ncbi:MAG: AraC family transcriptional regulator [Pirellulales bacterium]|nr:AraC family transcriptional regulator [Pirellulales bacterium]
MDALTDILRAMRLSGGVFLDAEFTAPWCITSQVAPEDCRPFMSVPTQLIAYHYVVEGALSIQVGEEQAQRVGPGQLLLLPRNDEHLLGSEAGLTPADANALIERGGGDGVARIRFGGGGARTSILCGFLGTNDGSDPLLLSLPVVVKLNLRGKSTGSWIEGSIKHAMHELANAGPEAASSLARMAELLFAEAVREYVKGLPQDQKGWLAGLRDPMVGKALAVMQNRLNQRLTLEEIARAIGASRSVLTDRFARSVGMPPMQYLRRRRLARAADRLTHGQRSVGEIGFEAGYESEAAFSRVFKREFGSSPTAFRDATRTR